MFMKDILKISLLGNFTLIFCVRGILMVFSGLFVFVLAMVIGLRFFSFLVLITGIGLWFPEMFFASGVS